MERCSSCLVFALWWVVKLVDSFKESTFSVSIAIWRCSRSNCLSVSTERKTGWLIGVEVRVLYDSRELEWLSDGKRFDEIPLMIWCLWFRDNVIYYSLLTDQMNTGTHSGFLHRHWQLRSLGCLCWHWLSFWYCTITCDAVAVLVACPTNRPF